MLHFHCPIHFHKKVIVFKTFEYVFKHATWTADVPIVQMSKSGLSMNWLYFKNIFSILLFSFPQICADGVQ